MTAASPEPVLVADGVAFAAMLARVAAEPRVALDTESNSFHAYFERVCLLQLSLPDADYIVDPLSVDVAPLGPLLASGREVVLHGADYDVRCLKREFGWTLGRIFDTMTASRQLGAKELGLKALVRIHFGVHLSKEYQRADWGRRPLPRDQMRYAALDTHFLLPLERILSEDLRARGLEDPARREFDRIAASRPHTRVFDPEGWRKLRGARALDEVSKGALRALWNAREERARQLDKPPFKVVGEDALVQIALRRPATLAELEGIPGVTPRVRERVGDVLLEALRGAG
ncbi:MAG TPA: ribonuclease D [Anaeromyxobacteraceae bacterium]|nr:ribonuclease D [Anaeromyxobacteraceae bacterium]